MKYDYAVVIGRFQPFHLAHKQLIEKALGIADRVIIILGSHAAAITSKNPWTSQERSQMILSSLSEAQADRVQFVPVRDNLYNENAWLAEIQQKVKMILGSWGSGAKKTFVLVGHVKDDSSYYLKTFPQWHFEEVKTRLNLNATDIRHTLFTSENMENLKNVAPGVMNFLIKWMETPEYLRLKEEYLYLLDYKKKWSVAPYPVTFVTADAVLTMAGHVLVVKRGGNPGKGQYALPGGFVNQGEAIFDSCLRELKEETKIKVSDMPKYLKDSKVFDHPQRSLRGRTITHAYHFELPFASFPEVKGADDAEEAFWMPISEVYSSEMAFFEDHRDIILYFLGR